MREGKGEFLGMLRVTVFIWESYPAGTNGKLCVHGCLVAPLYGKWNPNVIQAVHLEKGGGGGIPSRHQSVCLPSKKVFQALAKYYFQLTGEIAFRHFHLL